jgi:hypothetical protein
MRAQLARNLRESGQRERTTSNRGTAPLADPTMRRWRGVPAGPRRSPEGDAPMPSRASLPGNPRGREAPPSLLARIRVTGSPPVGPRLRPTGSDSMLNNDWDPRGRQRGGRPTAEVGLRSLRSVPTGEREKDALWRWNL